MQLVKGTWHLLKLVPFAIFGFYVINFLIVPSLPGFQQWVLPSMPTLCQQLPTSIVICPPVASNSTLPSNRTTGLQDHEAKRVKPSGSNPGDDQLLLAEEIPTAKVSREKSARGKMRRKKGPVLRGDDDPLLLLAEEEGEEQSGDDDMGFQIEETGEWLASEEHIDRGTQPDLHLEEEREVEDGGEEEIAGAGIASAEGTGSSPIGKFKVGRSPWLREVAARLAECASPAPIRISEYFTNSPCASNCTGRGVCNHQLGECRCFHGFTGAACDVEAPVECNLKRVKDNDGYYGPWIPSICSGTCDKRTGFCYCGADTKYPERPVPEQCGFPKIVGSDWTFNWNERDPDVFINGSTGPGWCNVDPADFIAGRVQKKKDCYCIYDGNGGDFCEIPAQSSCLNQCSGNGYCQGGFCACVEGWHGIDCSVPSEVASVKMWPPWLSNDIVNTMDHPSEAGPQESTKVTVERHRPLIYVYDLPPAFNSHLLEGRHFKLHCVTRFYDDENSTIWTNQLYGAEFALLESLLASKHRTTNPEEADFFYVPALGACATARAGDAPHMDMEKKHMALRPYFAGDMYKSAYEHIKSKYPYWDRSEGRDHIWMFPWDEGACTSPKEIWSSMMLVHWGNTNAKYNYSTTRYPSDNWTSIPTDWRGYHPCYDPEKDLVLPSWKIPDPDLLQRKLWIRTVEERPTLFYFRGNLGNKYETGRPEPEYSMGIRQRVAEEFGTDPNVDGHKGSQSAPDVKVFHTSSYNYSLELALSRFCGVFPGDGWSGRMEDSILHGCIPVIIQDGIQLPYENMLDYSQFAVRIAEDDLPRMVDILRRIPERKVEMMQSTIQTLWQRFTYHNSIQLEADRQERFHKSQRGIDIDPGSWINVYKKLTDDDAFGTFIQVLRFKRLQRKWQTTSKPSPECQ